MGMSTDACLFYGVNIYDPDTTIGEGVKCPEGITDEDEREQFGEYGELDYETADLLRNYFKTQGWEIEVGVHCSSEYPMFFLSTKEHSASRGYPEKIEALPTVDKSWNERLSEALKTIGLESEIPKIGWYLASYYSG